MKVVRKDHPFDCMQYTGKNLEKLREWICDTQACFYELEEKEIDGEIALHISLDDADEIEEVYAYASDWLVVEEDGDVEVYSNADFTEQFMEVN